MVLFSGKSCKAFPENEYSEWINSVDETVDSHVELEAINQVWLVHVTLCYILLTWFHLNVLVVTSQVDTSSLACCYWLYYKCFRLFLGKLLFEVSSILRKNPSLRREIVFLLEEFGHSLKISSQIIFVAKSHHPWIMIDPLIALHLLQLSLLHACVRPVNVPITSLILNQFKLLHSARFLDDSIPRINSTQNQLREFVFSPYNFLIAIFFFSFHFRVRL